MTKENAVYDWNAECKNAFEALNSLMLVYPDYEKTFTVTVDASMQSIGCVLSQEDELIAFGSKAFNEAEQRKATIEQELLAIHWSIEHYKHYLYGRKFIVKSNHKPLVH